MDARQAPQWIVDLAKDYKRRRLAWLYLPSLAWIGILFGAFRVAGSHKPGLGTIALLAGPVLVTFCFPFGRNRRARRYQTAVTTLQAAIDEYEKNSDSEDSAFREAVDRARLAASMRSIRTSPSWIRRRIAFYMLLLFAGNGVQILGLFLFMQNFNHWFLYLCLYVGVLLVPLEGVKNARHILLDAVDSYELAPEADESILRNAALRASAAMRFTNLNRRWQDVQVHSPARPPDVN